jgi:hypothetical protein
MFSRFLPEDVDEDPGATLIARATEQEINAVLCWAVARDRYCGDQPCTLSPTIVELPAWLSNFLSHRQRSNTCERRLRDLRILQSLVAGACILRSAAARSTRSSTSTANPEDYNVVRQLLRNPTLLPADVPCDPIATDMVSRANVYLAARSGQVCRHGSVLVDSNNGELHGDDGRPCERQITRREIADLGNVRSGMVRRLLQFLRQGSDSYNWYCCMGHVRRPPSRETWRSASASSLAASLRPWSLKQVRTHFERLHRDGLITAERKVANGPWRYELPEELANVSHPFQNLPSVHELTNHAPMCDDTAPE